MDTYQRTHFESVPRESVRRSCFGSPRFWPDCHLPLRWGKACLLHGNSRHNLLLSGGPRGWSWAAVSRAATPGLRGGLVGVKVWMEQVVRDAYQSKKNGKVKIMWVVKECRIDPCERCLGDSEDKLIKKGCLDCVGVVSMPYFLHPQMFSVHSPWHCDPRRQRQRCCCPLG